MKKKRKRNRQYNERDLIPYDVIKAATQGDIEAIERILDHYEGYINSVSRGLYIKPNGECQYVIDRQLHDEIVVKIIEAILNFEI